jgi:hypothetical protein
MPATFGRGEVFGFGSVGEVGDEGVGVWRDGGVGANAPTPVRARDGVDFEWGG